MKVTATFAAVLLGAAVTSSAVTPPAKAAAAPQCFRQRDITSWRAVGDSQVNLQVNYRDVYRLDLNGRCTQLNSAFETIGVKSVGAGDEICSGLQLDVIVPSQGRLEFPCPVQSMTKLTADEVKALPKRERP
ncbi:MAG: DUF6491 family protein [Caulobacteraceae bacterium]